MSTFGISPADVAADLTKGTPLGDETLSVWTTKEGTRIDAVTDLDGNPWPDGLVVTNAEGQFGYKTTDDFDVTWILDRMGNWYRLESWETQDAASQIIEQFPEIKADADQAAADAAAAAESAADAAESAREAAEHGAGSVLPPYDDMDHPYPYVSAHRGGSYITPEGTRIGRMNALGLGMQVIDGGDIHATSDGVLYDMHDSTVDRTTNLTGAISGIPSMRLMQGVIDCSTWFGGGFANQPITSIADTLNDIGGKTYVTFEVKTDVDMEYAQKIVDLIASYGLTEQILIASFEEDFLAPAIAAGHPVMLLGTSMTDVAADTDLINRGVLYVGGSQSMTAATAKTLMDNGHRVVTYSTEQHADVNKYRDGASGDLWGYISDDPLYLKGHVEGTYTYRRTTDPFAQLSYYHGFQADNLSVDPASRGTFLANSGGAFFCAPVSSTRRAWLQGWGCPLVNPTNYTITFEQDFLQVASSAGGGIVFGCPTDAQYTGPDWGAADIGAAPGYVATLYSSGLINLFRRDPNVAPVQIGTYDNNTNVVPGTPTKLSIQVTPTQIIFKRVGATAAQTITANDATYRGPYFHLAARAQGAAAGVRWRNISIT